MAGRVGKRYSLRIYTLMMDRWWPTIIALGLALLGLSWGMRHSEKVLFESWRWQSISGLGWVALINGIAMLVFRKGSYVQPLESHLKLVTPFLRLNISYKRFRRTVTTRMAELFPPRSLSSWKLEMMEDMLRKTAVVIELNGFPTSQTILRFFLSPFFFKDNTPHFVILVDDWMGFSTEVESMRSGGQTSAPGKSSDQSILSRLPHK